MGGRKVCRVLIGGRWIERAHLPHSFDGSCVPFCGELVLLGLEWRYGSQGSLCCSAFNLETNVWRLLEWELPGKRVLACCATDTVLVALVALSFADRRASSMSLRRASLMSLRPGSAEGWVPIPDPPVAVFSSKRPPSLCCVEGIAYVFGGADESGVLSNAFQALNLSTGAWTARAPLPEARSKSVCVQLAGRLYVLGGFFAIGGDDDNSNVRASEFSYDLRTDRWRSESPLPFEHYQEYSETGSPQLTAVSHEGRVVVFGIRESPPLALVGDVWTELSLQPLPPNMYSVRAASLPLGSSREAG